MHASSYLGDWSRMITSLKPTCVSWQDSVSNKIEGWGYSTVIEHLPNMCKGLGLISSIGGGGGNYSFVRTLCPLSSLWMNALGPNHSHKSLLSKAFSSHHSFFLLRRWLRIYKVFGAGDGDFYLTYGRRKQRGTLSNACSDLPQL